VTGTGDSIECANDDGLGICRNATMTNSATGGPLLSRRAALEDAALRLRNAYASKPIEPLRGVLTLNDGEGAYAIQKINTRHWVTQDRRRIVGRKIGLTAESVQKQLGVDQPDYGVLFADMEIPEGGELACTRVIQPKVEGEIAIVMARDLDGAEAAPEDVLRAAAYALPAIEIVDSRIAGWRISFADTVADNGSAAFFVLGREPRRLADVDLRGCEMILEANDRAASVGVGAACYGHPLNAAAWLARTLARGGEILRAGDIVLTGAMGPMVTLEPGMSVRTSIAGVGTVSFQFGARAA
jgi:2-keto-4-pentenoate hydratase